MRIVTLDCTAITSRKELHRALAENLQFPDWYGGNLDALFDCLTDLEIPTALTLTGWQILPEVLEEYGRKALQVLQDAAAENEDFRLILSPAPATF